MEITSETGPAVAIRVEDDFVYRGSTGDQVVRSIEKYAVLNQIYLIVDATNSYDGSEYSVFTTKVDISQHLQSLEGELDKDLISVKEEFDSKFEANARLSVRITREVAEAKELLEKCKVLCDKLGYESKFLGGSSNWKKLNVKFMFEPSLYTNPYPIDEYEKVFRLVTAEEDGSQVSFRASNCCSNFCGAIPPRDDSFAARAATWLMQRGACHRFIWWNPIAVILVVLAAIISFICLPVDMLCIAPWVNCLCSRPKAIKLTSSYKLQSGAVDKILAEMETKLDADFKDWKKGQ